MIAMSFAAGVRFTMGTHAGRCQAGNNRTANSKPDRQQQPRHVMDFELELVLLPVSDVDRAKAFYVAKAGFELDVDTTVGDQMRVVQVTPPGSACSVGF